MTTMNQAPTRSIVLPSSSVTCLAGESEPSALPWFIGRINPQKYRLVERELERRNLAYDVFSYQIRGRKQKPVTRFWFPGYVFVASAFEDLIYYQGLRIPGIVRWLSTSTGMPQALSSETIDVLRRSLPIKITPNLLPAVVAGDIVRVIAGPWKSATAECVSATPETVSLLVNAFNRSVKMILSAHDVRRVS